MLTHAADPEARAPAEDVTGGLFTQAGSDPTFAELLASGKAPRQRNSTNGVTGSTIHVNRQWVEALPEARRPIAAAIRLHTLLNSAIPRKEFPKWSRWYQEDGHTQIFRLFKGEVNRHNDRALAGRVEAFSDAQWTASEGVWHEWSGVITAVKPCGLNLQVKNSDNDWAVAISVDENGTVILNHRRGKDEVIARNTIGKPFLLRVRDNGLNYEVFFNGEKVGSGSYARPTGKTAFRWGMYVGSHNVPYDAMIFFSGVTVDD